MTKAIEQLIAPVTRTPLEQRTLAREYYCALRVIEGGNEPLHPLAVLLALVTMLT